jgi:hypothetical protein
MRRKHLLIVAPVLFLAILSLMLGMTITLIRDISWHDQQFESHQEPPHHPDEFNLQATIGHARAVRGGCQYYANLTADNAPDWLAHNFHWSAQRRIRTANQNLITVNLSVSERQSKTIVSGLVRSYMILALCRP